MILSLHEYWCQKELKKPTSLIGGKVRIPGPLRTPWDPLGPLGTPWDPLELPRLGSATAV